ncbi:MAG: hypothetical protein M0026_02395 [Nocardiopsaceae bacterium]|nr:hypothetical protein [Nocardiopsaceae bacterium]
MSLLILAVLAAGCAQGSTAPQQTEGTDAPPPSSSPAAAPTSAEPPSGLLTATTTMDAPYAPPDPPPEPAYDPCATDPITGNVQDGDCFPGIPVD